MKREKAWPLSLGWSVGLGVLTAGIGLLVPLAIYLHRKGHKRSAYATGGVVGLVALLIGIGIATSSSNKTESTNASPGGAKSATATGKAGGKTTAPKPTQTPTAPSKTKPTPKPKENVYVIASKSFCLSSGIDDAYTGNGHVVFSVMLKNSGKADGSVDIVPVRHYDDGQINESAMDMMTVDVAAGQRKQVNSPQFVYKAHEHEILSCGVIINGRDEVKIYTTSMSAITGG